MKQTEHISPHEFCDWLNGFFSLGQPTNLNGWQTLTIKDYLQCVFDTKYKPTDNDWNHDWSYQKLRFTAHTGVTAVPLC